MTDLAKNLEFWMTNLPAKLRRTPLINLAIPGSHDSTTFAITKKSKISPDARPPIQYLKFMGSLLSPLMIKWSRTQSATVIEQLNKGVRYFDLRISTKPQASDFFFVHNLYADNVIVILEQMKQFLDDHQKEVVILDCQHFYNFTQGDHQRFMGCLKAIFNLKLLPYSPSMAHVTLDYMTAQLQYQVIVVYRAEAAVNEELLWPSICLPTPWPDTVSIPHLIDFLDEGLKGRNSSVGFVSQCVLTPTVWFAVRHIFSCLRNRCALPLEKYKYNWLKQQKPGVAGINIVISDFIDEQDFQFCKEVIGLNRKLVGAAFQEKPDF